jgi:hypothetical protein
VANAEIGAWSAGCVGKGGELRLLGAQLGMWGFHPSAGGSKGALDPWCPHCGARLGAGRRSGGSVRCRSCGRKSAFSEALVEVGEAEALASERARCTCDERRGCPQCFRRAEEMVGRLVRDGFGREWRVVRVVEKDFFPTVQGDANWDLPDHVEVLPEP